MQSTFIDILTVFIAGIVGGNAIAGFKEYNLGVVRNTLVGAIGGVGGYFLQILFPIPPTVDVLGQPVLDDSSVNHMLTLALVGLAAGGFLTLVAGFTMSEFAKSRSQ